MDKNKKLSDYTKEEIKKIFIKPKRKENPELVAQFQKKDLGIKMMLDKINSEIKFTNIR